jgi:hypothetical protein
MVVLRQIAVNMRLRCDRVTAGEVAEQLQQRLNCLGHLLFPQRLHSLQLTLPA